jgi:predicted nuclease of predicted toxin-antitoxin system
VAALIESTFPGRTHLSQAGLERAPDLGVREYAGEHGFTIASKDDDFLDLTFRFGFPPKVVWLQVGNASPETIAAILIENQAARVEFDQSPEEAVMILP